MKKSIRHSCLARLNSWRQWRMSKKSFAMALCCLSFLLATPFDAMAAATATNWHSIINGKTLHVILCGTGTPAIQAQYLRHPACLAIAGDKQLLLFDAGEGASQTLGELGIPLRQLNNVFITHWHSDHFGGLGQIMNTSWTMGRAMPLNVYGPYGVKQVVNGLNQAYQLDGLYRTITNPHWNINNAFMLPHLVNTQTNQKSTVTPVYQKNNLQVSAFPVDHWPVVPALGYQVKFGNCKLVISGDTRIDPKLGIYYNGANVLVSEASSHAAKNNQDLTKYIISSPHRPPIAKRHQQMSKFSALAPSLTTKKREKIIYHSDSWDLAKLAQVAQVDHLVLTHLGPPIQNSGAAQQAFIKGMNRYYHGSINVADDRDQFELISTPSGCQFRYLPAK